MKKVLVVKGQSAYNVLRRAADEIAEGFRSKGYEPEIIDFDSFKNEEEYFLKLEGIFQKSWSEEYAFAFFMQAFFFGKRLNNDDYLVSKMGCPCIGWVFDDIMLHYSRLCAGVNKNIHIFTMDYSDEYNLKLMNPEIHNINALLHGGFEADTEFEKDIDIFIPSSKGKAAEWEREPAEWEMLLAKEALQLWQEDYSRSPRQLMKIVLERKGIGFTGEYMLCTFNITYFIYKVMYSITRKKVIDAVCSTGLNVHLLGSEEDEYPENVTVHGPMDIDEVVRLIRRSKVVINPLPNVIERGGHERIFTSWLNKSRCFSMKNDFLQEKFGDNIGFYDLANMEDFLLEVKDTVINFNAYSEKLDVIYKDALENHTWKRRGQQLAEYYEGI